jgi:hypothetical protein
MMATKKMNEGWVEEVFTGTLPPMTYAIVPLG